MFVRVAIHNSRSRERRKRQDHDVVRTIRRELEQERRNLVREVLRTLGFQLCQRGS
ncbi:hypothetical protein C8R44DRAFT_797926 [Mycena epipterygia]|nr:hypothetical protein C8R44DRAFT_797926 [Mycena epipterygia]